MIAIKCNIIPIFSYLNFLDSSCTESLYHEGEQLIGLSFMCTPVLNELRPLKSGGCLIYFGSVLQPPSTPAFLVYA